MKIDFSEYLYDVNGEVLGTTIQASWATSFLQAFIKKNPTVDETHPIVDFFIKMQANQKTTLYDQCILLLAAIRDKEDKLDVGQKVDIWKLFSKIFPGGVIDLEDEERMLLKSLAHALDVPMILYGQIKDLLEGKESLMKPKVRKVELKPEEEEKFYITRQAKEAEILQRKEDGKFDVEDKGVVVDLKLKTVEVINKNGHHRLFVEGIYVGFGLCVGGRTPKTTKNFLITQFGFTQTEADEAEKVMQEYWDKYIDDSEGETLQRKEGKFDAETSDH